MLRYSALTLALSCAALIVAPTKGHAQAGSMNVEIDRSARVQLHGTAASVIVANPNIADVTVVDSGALYIVGKGYGVTEVIAVDALGRTLFQREVIVTGGSTGAVRVWRGAQATEMACSSSCAPSVRSAGDTGASASARP